MPTRPDPNELLARLARSSPDGSKSRGRLKIFFGMAPGVGKTYAMLAAAQRLASQGVDIAVGVVETHKRIETEQLLLGMDMLPRKRVEYAGPPPVILEEFDCEASIARRPDILLVDELAHTNAPGSPRQKRWQDVLECLEAGVNVYTTLNVQHLESLNDVVAQITGVLVRETVPDHVFDQADEIELVDLAPEGLLERLRAGKVYLAENAARAVDPSDGFFRKGNLTALRELALRRTAAWVDSELRRYKLDRGIRAVWPVGERVIVAVSPSPMSERLVRAAKRMAAGLHADLIAVHVETPRTTGLGQVDRDTLARNLKLAESLGASTATIGGENAARELIAFARSRNASKILVGKTSRPRWKEVIFGSFVDNLIRESGDIDVYVVRGDEPSTSAPNPTPAASSPRRMNAREVSAALAGAIAMVAMATGCAVLCFRPPDLSEEGLLLLGGVVLAAIWFGRLAAVCASVFAVLAFNFFFVEPRYTLTINDPAYLLTFGIMLGVGLVVGTLAARTREQARVAWARERATAAQYALSRALASARDVPAVAAVIARQTQELLHADTVICVGSRPKRDVAPRTLDVLASAGIPDWFDERERGVARWALDHAQPAGFGTMTLPSAQGRFLPLIGTSGILGVLGIKLRRGEQHRDELTPAIAQSLDAIATQASSALERVMLSESEQVARLDAERERLRSALLSSVSHDLRTPLASITGAASTLEQGRLSGAIDASTQGQLLRTILDESGRLNDIIGNLVFATRLESGAISLRKEWTTVEEMIGVGLARHREALSHRPLRVIVPDDLPMLRVDNAMLPQVVHNLVENALRYTPAGCPITISAWATEGQVVIRIADEGPGISEEESVRVFERFYRGRASRAGGANPGVPSDQSGAAGGMGLGLTICEGVIRAHSGRIWAEPNTPKGVAFVFALPIEQPQPSLPREEGLA